MMEKIRHYDGRSSFDTWLFSVARNLAIDHLRRKRNISLDEPDESGAARVERLAAGSADPLGQLLESERGVILAAAVHRLPAIHREVVSLRFEEGMRLDQIAEVAGVPLSTVKSRLHRALESLRGVVESQLSGGRSK
ncbi:MAG: sigma-70 family RNA polymerase sigma factor [Acidobacteria bacterium]|nr:sigma-70 family RNA polymerase sigma factor [Acidobacteriota bacterium]